MGAVARARRSPARGRERAGSSQRGGGRGEAGGGCSCMWRGDGSARGAAQKGGGQCRVGSAAAALLPGQSIACGEEGVRRGGGGRGRAGASGGAPLLGARAPHERTHTRSARARRPQQPDGRLGVALGCRQAWSHPRTAGRQAGALTPPRQRSGLCARAPQEWGLGACATCFAPPRPTHPRKGGCERVGGGPS